MDTHPAGPCGCITTWSRKDQASARARARAGPGGGGGSAARCGRCAAHPMRWWAPTSTAHCRWQCRRRGRWTGQRRLLQGGWGRGQGRGGWWGGHTACCQSQTCRRNPVSLTTSLPPSAPPLCLGCPPPGPLAGRTRVEGKENKAADVGGVLVEGVAHNLPALRGWGGWLGRGSGWVGGCFLGERGTVPPMWSQRATPPARTCTAGSSGGRAPAAAAPGNGTAP